MQTPLDIRLLGPLEITVGGSRVDVSGPKRQALVALLALRGGRVVSVDSLVDALWGPDMPAAPRNAVQHHVARLRAALGPDAIDAVPDGYVLRGAAVDALRFEEELAAARNALRDGNTRAATDTVEEALSLWRGPALHGLVDADWAAAEAGRLQALRADALEAKFEAALALGQHANVVGEIRTALEEHPFRERLWGQLMLALYRSGRQADALETFQEVRRVLSHELGIEPSPDLQHLQAAILTHDDAIVLPSPATRRRGNVPAPVTTFVDREAALADVRRLLDEHRLVTLTGPPGVGKSRLAVEAARTIGDELPDGAWLVDLTRARREEDVAMVFAEALGADAATEADPLPRAVACLRAAEALVVLDGCDRVVDEAARIAAAALAGCPGVRVLATSREVLHLLGEARLVVPPLAAPDEQAPDVSAFPAVQLFVERARGARSRFELTPENEPLVGEICRRLDGLPLAIELAAARVNVLGLRDLLAALDDRSAMLADFRPLEALMAWSYDLLHGDEKTLLHELATLRGGTPLPAVISAAARRGLDERTVAHLLGRLVDKSIVIVSFQDGEPRYDLLESVRQHARSSGGPRHVYSTEAADVAEVRRRVVESEQAARNARAALQEIRARQKTSSKGS
ncbi:MAG TPA: BTAD domain-containing putative transcriptional regulator [Gaiellaceae bacterium]|nr:BTAD domain-containing putative transcriptional regulator [Gaiellaceae bacterium]